MGNDEDRLDEGSEFFQAYGEPLSHGWKEIDLKDWADEDRKSAATNANVDRAIRLLKRGENVLPTPVFGAVVKFMFDGFPKARKEALRSGRFELTGGRVVTRETVKVAA